MEYEVGEVLIGTKLWNGPAAIPGAPRQDVVRFKGEWQDWIIVESLVTENEVRVPADHPLRRATEHDDWLIQRAEKARRTLKRRDHEFMMGLDIPRKVGNRKVSYVQYIRDLLIAGPITSHEIIEKVKARGQFREVPTPRIKKQIANQQFYIKQAGFDIDRERLPGGGMRYTVKHKVEREAEVERTVTASIGEGPQSRLFITRRGMELLAARA